MTFNNEIEKTEKEIAVLQKKLELLKEKEIAVLQKKLELLKEIEAHKSQPSMNFELGGKFEVVSYNDEVYYRHEYPIDVIWYKRKYKCASDEMMLFAITDDETYRLLEGLWFNEIGKGRYNDVSQEWLPDEDDGDDLYARGWNNCLNEIKRNLR